ncbi:MAG TPA: AMP-binding protein [Actinomycetota bacterium]
MVAATVREFLDELSPLAGMRVTPDSVLDRDLGLDSLALVELIARLEAALGMPLTEESLLEARTLGDLVAAIPWLSEPPPAAPAPPRATAISPVARGAADAARAPGEARTLPEVLDWHAERHPERIHIRLLASSGSPEDLTYGELARAARGAAGRLLHHGLEPGDGVALMLPTGRDYFVAFLGALLAGGVPVPIYPPSRPAEIEEHLQRQASILDNARARLLVSVPEAGRAARLLRLQVPSLRRLIAARDLAGTATGATGELALPRGAGSDVALVQYTSGTTSLPKGVVLTHDNLLASIRAMGQAVSVTPADIFVSWLPLYHDMGLIGAWLGSLYFGMPLILMPPMSFLARPVRWLRAIHDHRGTISAAPNFGFELCLQRIDDGELDGLDLSSWRIAFNGAEAVSPATLRRFAQRFGPHGFHPDTMKPVYGLAEASLGLTFPPPGREPVVERIARETFEASGVARPAAAGEDALEIVGCGRPLPGFDIRVVDAAGEPRADRQEGRIEFRGPSSTSGYLRNPAATAELVHGGWLDTGDLGYRVDDELFVTGRVKDLIIRGGRNIHPQGIEEAVGAVPGVRKGRSAAFGVRDAAAGTERLVVVAETRERSDEARARVRAGILAACIGVAGAPPDEVVLAPPGTIRKTSSGKIRRADCRRLYEQGSIGAATPPVWRQVLHLASAATTLRLRRLPASAGSALYGLYAWGIVGLVAPPVWLLVTVVPPGRRWAVFRTGARVFLVLGGVRPIVEGIANLPAGGYVLVANHASILDGLVLAAVLPGPLVFPAAGELASARMAGPFLRRIGAVFVDRADRKEAAAASRRLLEAAQQGAVLAFFPEGTMSRVPGLHPFRMGAFVVSEEAGLPLVPVALRGTGRILRGDRRFPRHGRIEVSITAPLTPTRPGWPGAVELRAAARRALLAELDEADLEV